ncbi:hypothetical protein KR067_009851, partial [Drosophila pandora]
SNTTNTNQQEVLSLSPESPSDGESATGSVGSGTAAKTVAYTYEAFFVSDGRSKRKHTADPAAAATGLPAQEQQKTKYTCSECGKQYATSSNLSRHKQTHRSLDSQS